MGNEPTIPELERRMRPGASSKLGFLGPKESLEEVIARDNQTLKALGVSHEQIADALEKILQSAQDQKSELEYEDFKKRETRIPDLYHRKIPHFTLKNLPSTDMGYLIEGKLQVFIVQYRGFQGCPWECGLDGWSSFDFLILNRQSGEYVTGPGLIVHLIRRHHFFEGMKSPYRTDPVRLVRVLQLSPSNQV